MKPHQIAAWLAFALLGGSAAHAQVTPADPRTSMLAGSWVARETRSDGLTIEAAMSLARDGKFSGQASANGKTFMTYEGTWKLAGNRLNWVYTKSAPELPEVARVDSDELISVDGTTLVLRSDRSGEKRTYRRQG